MHPYHAAGSGCAVDRRPGVYRNDRRSLLYRWLEGPFLKLKSGFPILNHALSKRRHHET